MFDLINDVNVYFYLNGMSATATDAERIIYMEFFSPIEYSRHSNPV